MTDSSPPPVITPRCVGLLRGSLDRKPEQGAPEHVSAMFMFRIEGGASPMLVGTRTLDPGRPG